MPVMVEDYINGSFCHRYIGVNGEAARLPERDKGYIFRFTCSLSCASLHLKYAHTYTHIQYTYWGADIQTAAGIQTSEHMLLVELN